MSTPASRSDGPAAAVRAAGGSRPRRRRRRGAVTAARWTALTLVVAVLVLAVSVLYVGWRAQQVLDHVRTAAGDVPALSGQLTALDVGAARGTAARMQTETAAAVAITDDPVWRVLERVPWGGQNLRAAEAGARAADRLSTQGAGGAVDAASAVVDLRERALSLDLSPSGVAEDAAAAREGAERALAATTAARRELDGLDRRYLLPPAASALEQVEGVSASLERVQDTLSDPVGALRAAS